MEQKYRKGNLGVESGGWGGKGWATCPEEALERFREKQAKANSSQIILEGKDSPKEIMSLNFVNLQYFEQRFKICNIVLSSQALHGKYTCIYLLLHSGYGFLPPLKFLRIMVSHLNIFLSATKRSRRPKRNMTTTSKNALENQLWKGCLMRKGRQYCK